MTKKRLLAAVFLLLLMVYPCAFCACNLHRLLSGLDGLVYAPSALASDFLAERNIRSLFAAFLFIALAFAGWLLLQSTIFSFKSGMREIFPGVETPLPSGENQYGSARWLEKRHYKRAFQVIPMKSNSDMVKWLASVGRMDLEKDYDPADDDVFHKSLYPYGGIIVGQTKRGKLLYTISEDTHSLTIGATRSSKSRSIVLPSICVTALAGESMVNIDPKGELYFYTAPFLRRLGYEVICIDFENPRKSARYNFLQVIIDHVENGDISAAKAAANDLVEALVGKQSHGERVWEEGEKSILACSVMAVVYDNRNKPEYQNLTNVYHFISRMCAPIEGRKQLPLLEYLNGLDDAHPAKSLAGISNVAHVRTRSSFYASALATLRLFEDYNVADMTCRTDFDIYATGKTKRAIFIILPDEKNTYYSVASMFVYQQYQTMVGVAKEQGGRLCLRVEFFMDEIGNFSFIPNFQKLITVGGGRGLRFHLFVQGADQLDDVYGEKVSSIIRSNCETWLYLQGNEEKILEETSRRLGEYTVKTPSVSSNTQGGGGSASYSYTGRRLLTTDEVRKIRRPYQLVMSQDSPAILYAPDISKTIFNAMLGLGSKEHNLRLVIRRNAARPERKVRPPLLWGIWEKYEGGIAPAASAQPASGAEPYQF